jgi:hypothetical protein
VLDKIELCVLVILSTCLLAGVILLAVRVDIVSSVSLDRSGLGAGELCGCSNLRGDLAL